MSDAETRQCLRAVIARVVIAEACITVSLSVRTLVKLLGSEASIADTESTRDGQIHEIALPVRLQRAGMEMRLIEERTVAKEPDTTLLRLLARAWTIRMEVLKGDGRSLDAIAKAHGIAGNS